MRMVTLKAHFNGQHIVLDEPFDIPPNSQLAVTVLTPNTTAGEIERGAWMDLSAQGLAKAYSDSEPEYTAADLKR